MRNVFFLVLILISSNVVSFHNESHTFYLSKKLDTIFLMLPIGILYKSAILNIYSGSISLLISILSGASG